jgi:rhodanese-related sulfurtransferase
MSPTATAVRSIDVDALATCLDAGHVAQLWNVLTDDYFTGELIPGSRRVPLDQIGRAVAGTALSRDAAIVVYCSGPACPQSRAAAEKLAALGFTDVRAFEGGLEVWKAAGRPVERGAVTDVCPQLP